MELARLVKRCVDLPGYEVFQYRGEGGEWCAVTANDVNAYLRGLAGEEFSAKDFRTWGGTLVAAIELAERGESETATEQKKTVASVMRSVGERLGNTAAVARSSYVSPAVVELKISEPVRSAS